MTDPFVVPDPTSQQARALESTAGDGYVAVVMLEAALKDEEVDAAGQRVARGGRGPLPRHSARVRARRGDGAEARARGDAPPASADMRGLVRDAVVRTVATAGCTVSFSALTIACSIAGLLVMRSPMFETIVAGATSVALIAVACTITLVPAVITLPSGRPGPRSSSSWPSSCCCSA